ncbi:MAG: hypothetical protein AAFX07_01845 [Pseudomonadota bacterium]
MSDQDRIWALKDQRGDLKSTLQDVKFALADDRSDYRELTNEISALKRRESDLRYPTSGRAFSWGPSLESLLQKEQSKLISAKHKKTSLLNSGPFQDSWKENNRLERINDINEDIEDITQEIKRIEADIDKRDADREAAKRKHDLDVAEVEGQLYRLQAREKSLKLLIERRENRISSINSKIDRINSELSSLGEW